MKINPKNIYLLNRLAFGPKIEWIEVHPKLLTDFNYLLDWIFSEIPKFEAANEYLPKYNSAPKNENVYFETYSKGEDYN